MLTGMHSRMSVTLGARLPYICRQCQARARQDLPYNQQRTIRNRARLRGNAPLLSSKPLVNLTTSSRKIPPVEAQGKSPGLQTQGHEAGPEIEAQVTDPYYADTTTSHGDSYFEHQEETHTTEYKPATTWHGLRSLKPSEWDAIAPYQGFVAAQKNQEHDAIRQAVQQACAEVLVLHEEGLSLDLAYSSVAEISWSEVCSQIAFDHDDTGKISIRFGEQRHREQILRGLTQNAGETPKSSDTPPEIPRLANESQSLTLSDPILKFAILKRCSQLVGARVPDNQISSIRHTGDLLRALDQTRKPRKLAEDLLQDSRLAHLENVEISALRRSQITREREMGRLKLYDAALAERGLPIKMA